MFSANERFDDFMEKLWALFWRTLFLTLFSVFNTAITILVMVAILSNYYNIDVGSWISNEELSIFNTLTIHDGYVRLNSDSSVPFEILNSGSSNDYKLKFVGSSVQSNKSIEFGNNINGNYITQSVFRTGSLGDLYIGTTGKISLDTKDNIILTSLNVTGNVQLGSSGVNNVNIPGDLTVKGILQPGVLNLSTTTVYGDGGAKPFGIKNVTIENLIVSNILFDKGRLTQVVCLHVSRSFPLIIIIIIIIIKIILLSKCY